MPHGEFDEEIEDSNSHQNKKTKMDVDPYQLPDAQPPSTAEQLKIWNDSQEQKITVGQKWYFVSVSWTKKLVDHLNAYYEDPRAVPGCIDNSDIIDKDHTDEISRTCIEGIDYKFLVESHWEMFCSWYGCMEQPIYREVVQVGYSKENRIDIHRIGIITRHVKTKQEVEVRVSKYMSIGDFKIKCKEVFECTDLNLDRIRIWKMHNNAPFNVIIKEEKSFDALMVSDKDKMLFDIKNDADEWEQSNVSSSTTTSAFEPSRYSTSYSSLYSNPGLTGLNNLGNTCFMNSALQCLSQTKLLTQYVLDNKHINEINRTNPLGMKGEIASEYSELIHSLWTSTPNVAPRSFKLTLGKFAPRFSGFQQQDSQELLAFLLDGIHEDLNRVVDKPYTTMPEIKDFPDIPTLGIKSWETYKKRNDSVIVDLFQGQFKSRLTCPDCKKISIIFDPYMFLSLPLPARKLNLTVVFVPSVNYKEIFLTDEEKLNQSPREYKLTATSAEPVSVVIKKISDLTNTPMDELYLTEIPYGTNIRREIKPKALCSGLGERDKLYMFQVPKIIEEDNQEMEEDDQLNNNLTMKVIHKSESRRAIGLPGLVSFPKRSTMKIVCETLLSSLRTYCNVYEILNEELKRRKAELKEEEENLNIESIHDGDLAVNNNDNNENDITDINDDNINDNNNKNNDNNNKNYDSDSEEFDPMILLEFVKISYLGSSSLDMGPVTKFTQIIDGVEYIHFQYRFSLSLVWDDFAAKTFFLTGSQNPVKIPRELSENEDKELTLYDCFDTFVKEEQLNEDNPWYCSECQELKQAYKKMDLWKLPDVLVVHLKRFSDSGFFRRKLSTFVDFPLVDFDLSNYLQNAGVTHDPDVNSKYDLFAVSNHIGGLGGGHYTAYCYHADTKKWYDFDDSRVCEVTEDKIRSDNAYVLFYSRKQSAI